MAHPVALSIVAVSLAFGTASRVDAQKPTSSRVAEASTQPSTAATHIRVQVRAMPDSAYRILARVLIDRGYSVRDGISHSLTTDDRHVADAGMVRLYASVSPDSLGAVVQLSGEWRRLRRLWILSAVTKDSVVIAYGAGGSRGTHAWQELTAVGEALGHVITYTAAIRH